MVRNHSNDNHSNIATVHSTVKVRRLHQMQQLGYSCDCSKLTGFRCELSVGAAARSAFSLQHNESMNIVTEVAPMLYFLGSMVTFLAQWREHAAAPAHLRHAFVLTMLFTVVQHLSSLVSHTFNCVSARLSHAMCVICCRPFVRVAGRDAVLFALILCDAACRWFIDYAGIALNFVWNAPSIAAVALPDGLSARLWPGWLGLNVALTAVLAALAVTMARTYRPPPPRVPSAEQHRGGSSGSDWRAVFFGQGLLSLAGLAVLFLPNIAATLAAGFVADGRALALLAMLAAAVAMKELHYPERLFEGRAREFFDHSVLHSHCIWHLLVWLVQWLYCSVFADAIAAHVYAANEVADMNEEADSRGA
eukprot:SAG11_NODE_1075_length_5967_cov_7.848841_1_plen_363_part_00